MEEKNKVEKGAKKKSFLAGLCDKMDKKLDEKSKSRPCCCCKPPDKNLDKGCC